jgi:RimJ/RimL family protein N-acetyltransferase
MERHWLGADPLFFAVVEPSTGEVLGTVAFLRIDPNAGAIEVGHLAYSPRLQRTAAATEALCLLLAHAFALGYRRCEWKCDSLNEPSRRAALRLGFTFEGIFRQATVVKGRNRDTAWFSMLDVEWPDLHAAFVAWLSPENFAAAGRQRRRLEEFRNDPSVPRSNHPCVT